MWVGFWSVSSVILFSEFSSSMSQDLWKELLGSLFVSRIKSLPAYVYFGALFDSSNFFSLCCIHIFCFCFFSGMISSMQASLISTLECRE